MFLKNLWSFLIFGIWHKQIRLFSFFVNLLILIFAIVNIESILAVKSFIAALGLIFLNIIWQVYGTFHDFYQYFKHADLEEKRIHIDFEKINISEKEKQLGYAKLIWREHGVLISDNINSFLKDDAESGCLIDHNKSRNVRNAVNRNLQDMLLFLKCRYQDSRGKEFTNHPKLCLASDMEQGEPIAFCKGSYYYTHITNKTYFTYLYNYYGQEIHSPLFRQFGYNISSVSGSVMCDEIGVSTLGISNDGYIVVLRQNLKANASAGRLVPTGSGSADWGDYRAAGFRRTINHGTNRELFQETGSVKPFSADAIAKTMILGFVRWINMGGKPEFFSLSKMNIRLNQVNPQKSEQTPEIVSKYICNFKEKTVDFETLTGFLTEMMSAEKCSFQLYLNAKLLLDFIDERKAAFENFLFD